MNGPSFADRRSFRVPGEPSGPPRSVVGPGVLAAAFALMLTLAGTPVHLGVAAPAANRAARVVHVTGSAHRRVPARTPRSPSARSVLLHDHRHH